MNSRILLPVDDSVRCREAVGVLGKTIKDHPGSHVMILHCAQHLAALYHEELFQTDDAEKRVFKAQEKRAEELLAECRRLLLDQGLASERIGVRLKMDSIEPAEDILDVADSQQIRTIAVGRRGRSKLESLLLGSVTAKIAQYGRGRSVWIVDSDVSLSGKVLIGIEDHPESLSLVRYVAEWLAPIPGLDYTLLHLMPTQPPTFWDDGHILDAAEREQRRAQLERWRSGWIEAVERFMADGKALLVSHGVPAGNIHTHIKAIAQGIAQDMLNEIGQSGCQFAVIGRKSFRHGKPFQLGSHANKILYNAKRTILCLIDNA